MKGAIVEGGGQIVCWGWSREKPKLAPSLHSKGLSFVLIGINGKRFPYGEWLIKPGNNYHLLVSNRVIR